MQVLHRAPITAGRRAIVSIVSAASLVPGGPKRGAQLLVASDDDSVRLLNLDSFEPSRFARLRGRPLRWAAAALPGLFHLPTDVRVPIPRHAPHGPTVLCPLTSIAVGPTFGTYAATPRTRPWPPSRLAQLTGTHHPRPPRF